MIVKKDRTIYTMVLCLMLSLFSCKKHKYGMEQENKRTGEDLEQIIEQVAEMDLDRLPIGDADIKNVIGSGYYADKTKFAGKLLMEGKPTFMVRPRRFGKSLLISTIATIAEGAINKELFKNYFIYNGVFKDENGKKIKYDWKKYPVIRLDFSGLNNTSSKKLEGDLIELLDDIGLQYKIKITGKSLQTRFRRLINTLTTLKEGYEPKIVLLIDEYDRPVVNLDWRSQQHNDCMKVLKDFFTVVKSCAGDCQLIFLTGVTKFSLVNLGSGANIFQGNDVSLKQVFSDVAGYKEEDIKNLFKNRFSYVIREMKKRTGKTYTKEGIMEAIKSYYNGYRFSYDGPFMYNPNSVLSFFQEGSLQGYWYRTGDPSILLNQMRDEIDRFDLDWEKLRFYVTQDDIMFTQSKKPLSLEALMYQTGYLSIDTYNPANGQYALKIPNEEVRVALTQNIQEVFLDEQKEIGVHHKEHVLAALQQEDWTRLLQLFRDACFANTSYEALKDDEKDFQNILHAFLNGVCHHTVGGPRIRVEEHSGSGRSDITMDDIKNNVVYIIELKKNQSAEVAIEQIEQKNYSGKYFRKKKIVHIGLNCIFNREDINHRNINECMIEVKRQDSNNNLTKDPKKKFVFKDEKFVEEAINVETLEKQKTASQTKKKIRSNA
ncbi:AAA family ATPase [Cardinium endosymbiont of Culicoides punctatus]|uniref:AAA family ATPase n=1 Tax=Cardinium endosymbiont of Culicoides punctatus TaxID=2304601 RepID=UPI0010591208|nr:AAA family ATPase [Cardinium endosymbiont of Culicoides punctatus]TDG95792.1 hypothetical protein CCPUN_00770 [Cardinium endosymbiont of Culicoides punctatus]